MTTNKPAALRSCPVCGGATFARQPILWPALIAEWNLGEDEVAYIDDQQGLRCAECGCNLRSMTLAAAILRAFGCDLLFSDFCRMSALAKQVRVLEINEAGKLTSFLKQLANYTFASFPEIDMQEMSQFADQRFDLLVHSDTLEHVADPVCALRECRRVLAPKGILAFTIPIVVNRLSRRRDDLPPSYHGNPEERGEDIKVVTEYGVDFWRQLFEAGFSDVTLHSLLYPASLAIVCRARPSN